MSSNQGLKPTKHDMAWYFKNASGAAFIGMGAAIFIMTCVSGTLAYFGFSKQIIPYFENYEGDSKIILWFKDHLQPTRDAAQKWITKSGINLSPENIDLVISTGLIYIILKPVKVPVFLAITRNLAMRRIAKKKCIDTYASHKTYAKQVSKQKVQLFTDRFGIKKKTKKDSMANAYNHYKSKMRSTKEQAKEKIKEKAKEKVDLAKEKVDKIKNKRGSED